MQDFLIAGIGASAGGIRALKTFFEHVPADSGIAYVVILHLSPDHDSQLAEVLQTSAAIPVEQVRERTKVEPNHIYVIPPHEMLALSDGDLTLSPSITLEQRRAPVDIFFRTLADTRGTKAACVLLSGTGANGSMGLKRVKEQGGICLVQDPREAEYGDMPRNAIATGLVDHVLPVDRIPRKLVAYSKSMESVRLPDEQAEPPVSDGRALREVFTLLRSRTGHDFSNYKRATVLRRLARRMSLQETPDLPAYSRFLSDHPEEAQSLVRDLLISVTNFFRDASAFEALERTVIPRLFAGKTEDDHVRVWVPGCATGEEAYSIAMLLAEYSATTAALPVVQLFATDIDEAAIAHARDGYYTINDAADVSAERLKRFFLREAEGYRIRKELREMILFAQHNVIRDPPFSHLDLVSSRNLLIYLNRSAQRRVLEVFHFALNANGYLFLGSSESVEGSNELFVALDKDHFLFQSRGVSPRAGIPVPDLSWRGVVDLSLADERHQTERLRERISAGELHLRLLEQYAPPSIVVNEDHEIVHMSERAGQYLQHSGGEPSHNLVRAVRPELRIELRTALYQAAQRYVSVESAPTPVRIEDRPVTISVIVRPVLKHDDPGRGFFLVVFQETTGAVATSEPAPAPLDGGDLVRQLEEEISRLKTQLRSTIERDETQAEELKASNEELQAMNEELRSSTEELETSKEELQSLNEELRTVNQELKIKVDEQTQANNDIQNLINSTEIGTIFLDRASCIKMFTPRARDLFNLIPADRGRPLSDISSSLADADLHADVERVLERLERVEREVRTRDQRWHLMRLLPYRTADDRIDGVVVTFLDITGRKAMEEALRSGEERLRLVVESVTDDAFVTMDHEGRIESWNGGAERMFGLTAAEAIGQPADVMYTPEDRALGLPARQLLKAQHEGRAHEESWHVTRSGDRLFESGVLSPVRDADGALVGFVLIARDLTSRKRSEEELEQSRAELERRVLERTNALAYSNSALERELEERRRAEDRVRGLMGRLISIQEDERRSIARDLHDHLGQQLAGIALKVEALGQTSHGAGRHEAVDAVRQALQRLDRDLDFTIWQLRPVLPGGRTLVEVLAELVSEWSSEFGVQSEFHTRGMDAVALSAEAATNLYRITQEALNNVFKHARASQVSVLLERRDNGATLIIEDNGVGFAPQAARTAGPEQSLGLMGMEERAEFMGGRLDVESAPGKGTTVFLKFPLS